MYTFVCYNMSLRVLPIIMALSRNWSWTESLLIVLQVKFSYIIYIYLYVLYKYKYIYLILFFYILILLSQSFYVVGFSLHQFNMNIHTNFSYKTLCFHLFILFFKSINQKKKMFVSFVFFIRLDCRIVCNDLSLIKKKKKMHRWKTVLCIMYSFDK